MRLADLLGFGVCMLAYLACHASTVPLLSACAAADVGDLQRFQELWTPDGPHGLPHVQAASGAPGAAAATSYDDHKPRTPPPDLPSLLLDSRIVYLGMPVWKRLGQSCEWPAAASRSAAAPFRTNRPRAHAPPAPPTACACGHRTDHR